MKSGKAVGTDSVTMELLKEDIETSFAVLKDLLSSIWDNENIPDELSR